MASTQAMDSAALTCKPPNLVAVRAAVQSMVSCARASLDALSHRRIEVHHSDLEDFQIVIIEHGERTLRMLDTLDREL